MTSRFSFASWASFLAQSAPATQPTTKSMHRSSTCPRHHQRTTLGNFYLPILAICGATVLKSYSVKSFVLTEPILWGGHLPPSCDAIPHCQFLKGTNKKASANVLRQSAVEVEFSAASDRTSDTDTTLLSPNDSSVSGPLQKISRDDLIQALAALVEQAERAEDRNQAVQAAATAEELLKQYSEKPDAILANFVLLSWARVSGRLSEMHRMNQQQQNQHQQQQHVSSSDPTKNPTLNSQGIPIAALVDVSQCSIYHAHDAAEQAEQLLHALKDEAASSVDTISFNAVLDAWAKSRDPVGAERCATLLRQMENAPFTLPNARSYHYVLEALAYSNAPDRMEQLHHWYEQLQKLEQHGTTATTNTLLSAYSRWSKQQPTSFGQQNNVNGSSAQIAQAAVQRFRNLQKAFEDTRNTDQQPDARTVTLVLECLSQCRTVQSAQLADEIFSEFHLTGQNNANEKNHNHQPSTQMYLALILAWRNSGVRSAATRAEELLEEVLKNRMLHPNSALFTAVIQCWGHSRRSDQATKALGLLQRLRGLVKQESGKQQQNQQSLALAPSIRTYNAVLFACAQTKGSDRQQLAALQVAFAVHKAMQLDANITGSGNNITFATLLRAVANLLPAGSEERNPVATAVMKKAIADGVVDRNVIKTLQQACDSTLFTSLLSKDMKALSPGHFDWNSIPEPWSRNVPRQ